MKTSFGANQVLKGKSIELAACGAAHTIVKTSNNEVYSFGLNDKGQLGLGKSGNFTSVPYKIKSFTSFTVSKICCSDESSCLVTN